MCGTNKSRYSSVAHKPPLRWADLWPEHRLTSVDRNWTMWLGAQCLCERDKQKKIMLLKIKDYSAMKGSSLIPLMHASVCVCVLLSPDWTCGSVCLGMTDNIMTKSCLSSNCLPQANIAHKERLSLQNVKSRCLLLLIRKHSISTLTPPTLITSPDSLETPH